MAKFATGEKMKPTDREIWIEYQLTILDEKKRETYEKDEETTRTTRPLGESHQETKDETQKVRRVQHRARVVYQTTK